LYGGYPFWVPYITLEGGGGIVLDIVLKMGFDIRVYRKSFSWEIMCLWNWRSRWKVWKYLVF
jgi:hypothetical protein